MRTPAVLAGCYFGQSRSVSVFTSTATSTEKLKNGSDESAVSRKFNFFENSVSSFPDKKMICAVDAHKRRMQLNRCAGWIGAPPWTLMNDIFGIVITILVIAFAVFAGLNKERK